jgi:hypothetical protein
VKKKSLGLVAVLMAIAMLATPVLAIGPTNAINNPNVDFPAYGVGLYLPNGRNQEWVKSVDKHLTYLDARDFAIKNAFVITDISQVAGLENKWVFFSADKWGDWMCFIFGAEPGDLEWGMLHAYALKNYPSGVYYREVLVGN